MSAYTLIHACQERRSTCITKAFLVSPIGAVRRISARPLPHQPQRICLVNRISPHIPIGINSAIQPNRIAFDVPACVGVVVSEVVIAKASLRVKILPREAEVEFKGLGLSRGGIHNAPITKGLLAWIVAPDHLAGAVGQGSGGIQVIALDGKNRTGRGASGAADSGVGRARITFHEGQQPIHHPKFAQRALLGNPLLPRLVAEE